MTPFLGVAASLVWLLLSESSLQSRRGVLAFLTSSSSKCPTHRPSPSSSRATSLVRRPMVRNIDLVEALIFYGADSIFVERNDDAADDPAGLLPGVEALVDECRRDDTAVLAIVEDDTDVQRRLMQDLSQQFNANNKGTILFHSRRQTAPAPNPRDLYESIQAVEIQPKGFGGSSGFGSKAPDPRRTPLPKHCVVLCSTEDQCRAARYMGMRVLCLTDNALADAVIDYGDCWANVYMDDIATPGSFWLNPPHPRDDEGNGVDPLLVMERCEREGIVAGADTEEDEANDDYLATILADMDPL